MASSPQETLRRSVSSTQEDTPAARIVSPANVKWWGATGLGVVQEAAFINAAIDFVSTLGGGTVFVPKGTYLVSGIAGERIYLKSKVRLEFEAGCAINSGQHGATSIIMAVDTAQQATIEDVTIEGNGLVITGNSVSAQTQYGISVGTQNGGDVLRNVLIRNIVVKDVRTDGITTGGNAGVWPENIRWEGIVCDNCYRNGGNAIHGKKISYYDCVFKNTVGAAPKAGFDVEPDAGLTVEDLSFVNCKFHDNGGAGLNIITAYVQRVIAMGCTAASNVESGFVVQGVGPFTLTSCISRNNTIYGFNINAATGHVELAGCVAANNTDVGFLLSGSRSLTGVGCTAFGNVTSGFQLAGAGAVPSVQTLSGCISYGNTLHGFALAFVGDASLINCSAFANTQEGIKLYGAHNCNVIGCLAVGNSLFGDAASDNIVLEHNSNYNNLDGNVCRMAARFFNGTASSGGAATVTLPATAAKDVNDWYTGMTIRVLSGTGSGQTKTISGYVASTGVVTVSVAWATPPDGTSVVEIATATRPRYGMLISAGCTGNKATNNDLYLAGTTAAFLNSGTGTVVTSGNRVS